jgi:hypothetical protein
MNEYLKNNGYFHLVSNELLVLIIWNDKKDSILLYDHEYRQRDAKGSIPTETLTEKRSSTTSDRSLNGVLSPITDSYTNSSNDDTRTLNINKNSQSQSYWFPFIEASGNEATLDTIKNFIAVRIIKIKKYKRKTLNFIIIYFKRN